MSILYHKHLLLRGGAGLFLVLLILFLSISRLQFEATDKQIILAVDYSDLRDLSLYRGYSLDRLLNDLSAGGFTTLLLHEETIETAILSGRATVLPQIDNTCTRLLVSDSNLALDIKDILTCRYPGVTASVSSTPQGWCIDLPLALSLQVERSARKVSWPPFKRSGIGFHASLIRDLESRGFFLIPAYVSHRGETSATIGRVLSAIPWSQPSFPLIMSGHSLPPSPVMQKQIKRFNLRPVTVEFGSSRGWRSLKETLTPGTILKAHLISREEMYKNPESRIVLRLARAARERRARILCPALHFLPRNAGDVWEENLRFMNTVRTTLEKQGFSVINEMPGEKPVRLVVSSMIIIPIMAVFLAAWPGPGALGGFILLFILSLFMVPEYVQIRQVFALWAALFFPTVAIVRFWKAPANKARSTGQTGVLVEAVKTFLTATGFTLFGAMAAGTLLATPETIYGVHLFRGVKLAYLFPPLMVAAVLSCAKESPLKIIRRACKTRLTAVHLLLSLVVITGVVLYLTRSGNTPMIKTSLLERNIRDWLETLLLARPRTKEMLLGHPAFIVGMALLLRQPKNGRILLAMLATVGQVSLFNTFCHFQTPLVLSLLRSINGLWMGVLLGVAAAWLIMSAGAGRDKPRFLLSGYFGKGNLGDDLILAGEILALRNADPDCEIEVLSGSPRNVACKFDVESVNRFNPFQVLSAMIRTDCLITGGGGILQDVTGRLSPYYYLTLAKMARLLDKLDVHWGIGIGPFKSSTVTRMVADELTQADLVFIRERFSLSWFDRPTIPYPDVTTGADLAFFLADMLPAPRQPVSGTPVTLGLSIRPGRFFNSIKGDLLNSLAQLLENTVDKILIFPFDKAMDEEISRDMAGKLGKQAAVLSGGITLEKAIEAMDEVTVMIGMRLHSLILACLRGRPFIGMPYDPKVSSFIDTLGLPEHAKAMRRIQPETLKTMIRELVDNQSESFQQLTQASSDSGKKIKTEAQQIVKLIKLRQEPAPDQMP